MLKCLFVDLTSIKSAVAKNKFTKSQIEKLADSILATDGLISPLILSQTGVDRYTIIEGDLAYYAALRAKEKDLRKAEMVNAFVIPADCQQAAIAQLTLLSKTKSMVLAPEPPIAELIEETAAPTVTVNIDELFQRLSAEIARQLVPLSQQLATVTSAVDRHERILALQTPATIVTQPPAKPTPTPEPIVSPTVETVTAPNKTSTNVIKSKAATAKARQQPKQLPEVPTAPIKLPATVTTVEKAATTKKAAAPKTSAKPDAFAGVDPEKLARTLELINTSDLTELTLRMSKSAITKKPETLATDLLARRDTQPDRRFESWHEIVAVKIPKLNQKLAIEIVNKLK